MKDIITLSFLSKRANVRIVRAVVRNFLLINGVFEQDIFDTELALDEAVANVIEHTYKEKEDEAIILTLIWHEDNTLEVLIRDFGEKVDPSKVKPRPLEELREGGLGVYIIRKVFDIMEWQDIPSKGNLLHLKRKFNIPDKE